MTEAACVKGFGELEKGRIKTRVALSALVWATGLLMPLLIEKFGGGMHLESP